MKSPQQLNIWLLVIPVALFFYVGLFVTMLLWYPSGLSRADWQSHLINFSIVYVFWLIAFFVNQLFDSDTLRSLPRMIIRLLVVALAMLIIAVLYFYFQPGLLITPRRFLLVHIMLSGIGISLWYVLMYLFLPHTWVRTIYAHEQLADNDTFSDFVKQHSYLGMRYGGEAGPENEIVTRSIVVFPARATIDGPALQSLYGLRRRGVRFMEFYEFHESLTRSVHLETLNELWFLRHVDYGSKLYDLLKRTLDIMIGFIGTAALVVLLPFLAIAIKLSSKGPVFFKQSRVGKDSQPFLLYKLRTMSGGATDTWTTEGDRRITAVGKWLRKLRLDELPQFINMLQGNMSLVGPRPEQVGIVAELKEQIPYYDERHIVKPGITGWAQLHVYAGNLAETKRKLQYDLYYVKHRSLMFDLEIILRTIYKVLTFGGR